MKHKLQEKWQYVSDSGVRFGLRFEGGLRIGVDEACYNKLNVGKEYAIVIDDGEGLEENNNG